jgi:lysophospholipase L1-like esterase
MVNAITKSTRKKAIVFLCGIIVGLALLELALYFVGVVEKSQLRKSIESEKSDGNTVRVLCVGDSFVEGVGAPSDQSYPRQLEALLNAGRKEQKYKVINAGLAARNTSLLLEDLPRKIDADRPAVVIILVGGANLWNYKGYKSNRERRGRLVNPSSFFYSVHTFKLAKLLIANVRKKQSNTSSPMFAPPGRDIAANVRMKQDEKHGSVPIPSVDARPGGRDDSNRQGWCYRWSGNFQEAARCFEHSIKNNPDDINSYLGLAIVYRYMQRYAESEICCKKCIQRYPRNSSFYAELGQTYKEVNRYRDALQVFERGVLSDPCATENNNYDLLINLVHDCPDRNVVAEAVSFLLSLRRGMDHPVPLLLNAADLVEGNIDAEIMLWITQDMGTIIRLCRDKQVPVILLNYPGNNTVNHIIGAIAKKYSVPLVDNHTVFSGLWGNDYYFSADGHCNARGYGVMAKNVYDKLREIGIAKKQGASSRLHAAGGMINEVAGGRVA